MVAYGSSDSFNVIAQDPTRMLTSDTHLGFNHVMAEWVTTFAGWSSRLASTYGNGDQSISTGTFGGYQRYHRLYSREDLSRRLHRTLGLTMGLDVILSYDWARYDFPLPREGRRLGGDDAGAEAGSCGRSTTRRRRRTSRRSGRRFRACAWSPASGTTTTACSTPTSGRSIPAWRCAGP